MRNTVRTLLSVSVPEALSLLSAVFEANILIQYLRPAFLNEVQSNLYYKKLNIYLIYINIIHASINIIRGFYFEP